MDSSTLRRPSSSSSNSSLRTAGLAALRSSSGTQPAGSTQVTLASRMDFKSTSAAAALERLTRVRSEAERLFASNPPLARTTPRNAAGSSTMSVRSVDPSSNSLISGASRRSAVSSRIERSPLRTAGEPVSSNERQTTRQVAKNIQNLQVNEPSDTNMESSKSADTGTENLLEDPESQRLLRDLELIESLDLELQMLERKSASAILQRAQLRDEQAMHDRRRDHELQQTRVASLQRAKKGDTVDIQAVISKLQGDASPSVSPSDRDDKASVASSSFSRATGAAPTARSLASSMHRSTARRAVPVSTASEEVDTTRPALRKTAVITIGSKARPDVESKRSTELRWVPRDMPNDSLPDSPPRSVVSGLSTLDTMSVAPSFYQNANSKDYVARNVELAKTYSITNRLAPSEENRLKFLLEEDGGVTTAENERSLDDAVPDGERPSSSAKSCRSDARSLMTAYTAEGLDAERVRLINERLTKMVEQGTASEHANISEGVVERPAPHLKLLPFFLTEDSGDAPPERVMTHEAVVKTSPSRVPTGGDAVIREEREAREMRKRLARVEQALAMLQGLPGAESGLSVRTRDAASVISGLSPPRFGSSSPSRPFSAASLRTAATKYSNASTSSAHRRLTRKDIDAELLKATQQLQQNDAAAALASRENIEQLLSELRASGLADNLHSVLEPSGRLKWRAAKQTAILEAIPDLPSGDYSDSSDEEY